MYPLRQINIILGFIPLIWFLCYLTMLLVGIYTFGRLPIYILDNDPNSLGIDWLNFIGIIGLGINLMTIPIWLVFSLILIFKRTRFKMLEIISMLTTVICIFSFILLKYKLPDTFAWIMD